MQGGSSFVSESSFQLRVELSANGRRSVKTHFSQQNREMYENRWHFGDYEDEMYRGNRYYRKARNHRANVWFKITIPHGRRYKKSWLLNSIEQECGFRFEAFQFHYMYDTAVFFVDSFNVAKSLVRASKKIQGENYYKIIINAAPSKLPFSHTRTVHAVSVRAVTVSDTEGYLDSSTTHIQRCLQKRYNDMLQSLDLSNLSNDPGLQSVNIFLPLNKASSIDLILQMLSEFFPQLLALNLSRNNLYRLTGFASLFYTTPHLRSLNLSNNKLCQVQDLELIQNLGLRELWLEGNPIYASMMNTSVYYRSVVYHFPGIQYLDGHFFKPNFFFDFEIPKALPPVKGSFCVNEDVKSFLMAFLHRFFTLYDSGRRQALLPFYHEDAVYSFSLPNIRFPKTCLELLQDFWKENRNLMTVRKPDLRIQLLKHNKLQVVGFLCDLPETLHDLQSFTLDVSLQTMSLVCFSLEGKFKEDIESKDLIRTFKRTFIIVPSPDVCAQILNDQMVILNSYTRTKTTTPALRSFPRGLQDTIANLDPERVAIVTGFSERTTMKMDWALKCLDDNKWNLDQAGEMFLFLKNKGAIPHEAFSDPVPRAGVP